MLTVEMTLRLRNRHLVPTSAHSNQQYEFPELEAICEEYKQAKLACDLAQEQLWAVDKKLDQLAEAKGITKPTTCINDEED